MNFILKEVRQLLKRKMIEMTDEDFLEGFVVVVAEEMIKRKICIVRFRDHVLRIDEVKENDTSKG